MFTSFSVFTHLHVIKYLCVCIQKRSQLWYLRYIRCQNITADWKAEDIVKGILKHYRSSHRPEIHQCIHPNKSIFCVLFFTPSRPKGTAEEPWYYQSLRHNSVRGQYHYCGYHHVKMPGRHVGGSWESKFTAAVRHYSSIIIAVMLIAGHTIITPGWMVSHTLFTLSSLLSLQLLASVVWQESEPFCQLLETREWGWRSVKSMRKTVWSRKQTSC